MNATSGINLGFRPFRPQQNSPTQTQGATLGRCPIALPWAFESRPFGPRPAVSYLQLMDAESKCFINNTHIK